jgi:hypothetical protein
MAIITAPSYRGAGTIASSASAGITIAQPTTVAINDILIIVICTANDVFATWPPTGWTEVPNPPTGFGTAGAAGGVRLLVAWKRATATTGNAVTTGNPGATNNYTIGQMFAIQDVARRGDPWESTVTNNNTTASTFVTYAAQTTLGPQRFIFQCLGGDADIASTTMVTVSALPIAGFTERSDNWVTNGVGGGIWVGTGVAPTPTTLTGTLLTLATSQVSSEWQGILRPIESHSRSIVF